MNTPSPEPLPTVSGHPRVWVFMVVSCLIWAGVQWFSAGNLDGYHDMLENYAWSQAWDWGTHKHPPLFAWVVGLWFTVFPQGDLSYRLLAYTNVAVGLWGVVALGRRLGLGAIAGVAALLLLWSFPYSTLAAKFNANAQLLSLWPWTAACLLASWQERGHKALIYSVLLGLTAAASMLSKYYSGLFLLGFLLPVFLTGPGRHWLTTLRPYLALLVFGLALLPHALWVIGHDGVTLAYAGDQGAGAVQWRYVLRFLLAPLYYWLPAWLACLLTYWWVAKQQHVSPRPRPWSLAWQSWQPTGWGDVLFWLAVMPWALTLACGVAGVAELSTPWAIPIGYAYPLLWLRNLQRRLPGATEVVQEKLLRAQWPVLGGVLLLGAVLALSNARSGQENYYRPSQALAHQLAEDWAREHPGVRLGWVAGDWAENAVLAFYALPAVRTLPGFPDEYPARYSPHALWQTQAGLVICPLGPVTAQEPRTLGLSSCEKATQAWLTRHAWPVQVRRLQLARQGWAFPVQRPFAYAVYTVLPERP